MRRRSVLAALSLVPLLAAPARASGLRWGANLVEARGAPYGSDGCARVLDEMAEAGLTEVAPVVFRWQAVPEAAAPEAGSLDLGRLAAVLRQARAAGLAAWPKVHLWIPGHWAGAARPPEPEAWLAVWADLLGPVADVAAAEGAAGLVVGTELVGLDGADGWDALAASVRRRFPGPLAYAAHGAAGIARFRGWGSLDEVAVSLWPPLGGDPAPGALRAGMAAALDAVAAAAPAGRPVWIAEVGMRSKHGAQAEPWRSPEETMGAPDEALQARALALWDALARARGVPRLWWWCCYTDPASGGVRDTDFTPQGKLAWRTLSDAARGRAPDLGGR
jgi:hypothetical protein